MVTVGIVDVGRPEDSGDRAEAGRLWEPEETGSPEEPAVEAGRREERRGRRKVGERGQGWAAESGSGEPAVTVLHISDTQFGVKHVFGRAGLTEADRAHSSLFGRLHDDLRGLADREGLHPDLVVVTGDLTETGGENEFDQVYDSSRWQRPSISTGIDSYSFLAITM